MKKDWKFLENKRLIQTTTRPDDIVDMSFAEAAVKTLGAYKKP